jgi:hypothetical protein
MISVRAFTGEAGIRTLAPAWRSLTAQLPLKRHFHHVEWYLSLAETFERHNLPPLQCVAVFSDDNRLVAAFPFRLMPLQIGPMQLKALHLEADHINAQTARDFVMAPGVAQTTFFQGFVKYMAEENKAWDVISLLGILEDSSAATALDHSAQLPFIQMAGGVRGMIVFITCGSDDRPLERLSKGFRQNLRTAHNKLKATQVTFEIAHTESDLVRVLPDFLKVESSGWKGELGTSALRHPETNTFLRRLIAHFGSSGGCEIHLMRFDNEPVAALFGIVTGNIWYIFRIGYDESQHRISPGHLIIENLLKQNSDQKHFDILTPYNAPSWLHAWKPDRLVKIFNAYVFRPTPEGVELAKRAATILRDPA